MSLQHNNRPMSLVMFTSLSSGLTSLARNVIINFFVEKRWSSAEIDLLDPVIS